MNLIFSQSFKNVWILTISSALAGSLIPVMLLVGSLIGTELAPNAKLATAPLALMILGTAASVVPISACMRSLGRKLSLWLFMAVGIATCGLAVAALQLQSFTLFCLASLILGSCNGAILQTRFAAMESVPAEQGAAAASMVMAGGIIAAFVGPELAVIGLHLTSVDYQGSFILGAGCVVLAMLVLALYRPATTAVEPSVHSQTPALRILANPSFCLALASGSAAYIIMSFVMTGTPISMHHVYGHNLIDTKWVIQSHIAAMFLPSFIAPLLFKLISIRGMMLLGLACYGATILVGISDTSVNGFWLQLVLLGVGWNFLFVAGTSLLPSTHAHRDRFKAQALNDFTIFSLQAIAALSAGWVINLVSWQQILLGCLVPMAAMLTVLVWEKIKSPQLRGATD